MNKQAKKTSVASGKELVSILKTESPYLAKEFGVRKIGFFGSFAAGRQTKHSDVDIAVEFSRPIGLGFVKFADHLEKKLGRKVDIITSEGIKNIRVKRVAHEIKRSIIYV